ncbi:VOC family protein [Oceanisphaera sp. KMM 10153]|uniref:VOC family protein n=1 Tax=Oceanisphaera submarina TaxID=3390193 RepID=UPI003976DDD7
MPTLDELLGEPHHFLAELELGLLDHGLPPALGPMDHICYRAADPQEYLRLRSALARFGDCLVEGMIGNRPIITFRLHQPLASSFGPIPCIELAAPKAGKQHRHGLEHGEIVVNNLQQLLADYPWIPFNTRGLQGHPPELTLALPPYQVKFHHHSLADTIALEIARGEVIPVPADYWLKDSGKPSKSSTDLM